MTQNSRKEINKMYENETKEDLIKALKTRNICFYGMFTACVILVITLLISNGII